MQPPKEGPVRKALTVLVVLLVAAAFFAGYWPQREKLVLLQAEAAEARRALSESQSQLAAAEEKARLGRVFGQFLALHDAVAAGNFGEAQPLSSSFFDQARDEAAKTSDATARTALDAVTMRRDAVTAGLARGEGSVREILVPIERELRRALGYPAAPVAPGPPVGQLPPPEARP
jgi:hypothetical protein